MRRELERPTERGCERVVLCQIGLSSTPVRDAITIHRVIPIQPESYRWSPQGSAWDPKITAIVSGEAAELRLGTMVVHSHGHSPNPTLSPIDRASFERLLVPLKIIAPDGPHASIVLGAGQSVGGLAWIPDKGIVPVVGAMWIDSPIRVWPGRKVPPRASAPVYDRQKLLIGEYGQGVLKQARLGIVGLGGGGSIVAQQVIRAGFGTVVSVDNDIVEDTNRSRMAECRISDTGKSKTEVIARIATDANPEVKTISIKERFPSERGIDALKLCDVIVACVDSFTSRSELIRFSWRHLIPLVDIGIGTQVEEPGTVKRLRAIAGHVHVYLPGGPCMFCTGLLSQEKIEIETGGRPEYARGTRNPGQMMSFNGVVSSLAVIEAIQLVTGVLIGVNRPRFLQYDGMSSSLYSIDAERDPSCPVCSGELGMGDPKW